MKVTHLVGQLDTGGTERFLVALADALRSRGVELDFVSLTSLGAQGAVLRERGHRVHTLGMRPGLRPFWPARLALLLRRLRPDVLHTHGAKPLLYGAPAGRLARVPRLIHTVHSRALRPLRPTDRAAARIASLCDVVAGVSENVVNECRENGYPARKLRVVHNGLALPSVPEGAREPGLMIFVGRLVPEKDPVRLVDAFAEVRRRRADARLVFVGDGPLRAALEARVAALSLGAAVQLPGAGAPEPWFRRASLFVLSSVTEGLPMALLEAMAHGTPVVATRVGGIPELIESGRDGLLVPAGDTAALAGALERLLSDADLARSFAERARRRVVESHGIDTATDAYLALYRR